MFGTAPIEIDVWLYAIPFCLVMLVLDKLRKARLRLSGGNGIDPRYPKRCQSAKVPLNPIGVSPKLTKHYAP